MSGMSESRDPSADNASHEVVEHGLSRRDFLGLGAAAGAVVATAGVTYLWTRNHYQEEKQYPPQLDPNAKSAYDSAEKVQYPDRLSQLIADGLVSDWKRMAVFPGLFIASPGAKFFSDVTLTQEVNIGLAGDARAFILRPVFAGESLRIGTGVDYSGDDLQAINGGGLDTDTFAFLSPSTGGVVFGNFSQNVEDIEILTRLHGEMLSYTSKTHSNLPMQFIDIDVRKTESGLIVPAAIDDRDARTYVYSDTPNEYGLKPRIGYNRTTTYFAMAQGRIYGGADTINEVIYDFSAGDGDPVHVEPDIGEFVPDTEN